MSISEIVSPVDEACNQIVALGAQHPSIVGFTILAFRSNEGNTAGGVRGPVIVSTSAVDEEIAGLSMSDFGPILVSNAREWKAMAPEQQAETVA